MPDRAAGARLADDGRHADELATEIDHSAPPLLPLLIAAPFGSGLPADTIERDAVETADDANADRTLNSARGFPDRDDTLAEAEGGGRPVDGCEFPRPT
jgi:hypothetical protein